MAELMYETWIVICPFSFPAPHPHLSHQQTNSNFAGAGGGRVQVQVAGRWHHVHVLTVGSILVQECMCRWLRMQEYCAKCSHKHTLSYSLHSLVRDCRIEGFSSRLSGLSVSRQTHCPALYLKHLVQNLLGEIIFILRDVRSEKVFI